VSNADLLNVAASGACNYRRAVKFSLYAVICRGHTGGLPQWSSVV
jgi:hypothetical protein